MKKETLAQKLNRAHIAIAMIELGLHLTGIPSKETSDETRAIEQIYNPLDAEYIGKIRDEKTGEVIKIIKTDFDSGTTFTLEKRMNGGAHSYIERPINYKDKNKVYEIEKDVPITLKSKSR